MTSTVDTSKWRQQQLKLGLTWMMSAMTSVKGWRHVRARDGAWEARDLKQRRVEACEREPKCAATRGGAWGAWSAKQSLWVARGGVWGCMQSPTASRLSRVCRLVQDDLCGTFKTVIRAIFVTVMQKAVVCAVWNFLTTAAAGPKSKENG